MKKIILLLVAVLFTINANAQDEKCFKKGTSALNLGVGIGSEINFNDLKPIYTGSYEYGIAKAGPGIIGLGVTGNCMINYYNIGSNNNYNYKNISTTTVVGIRGVYHPDFCNGKKYDVYGAVQLNVYIDASSTTSDAPNFPNRHNRSVQKISPSLLVGARYFFVQNFGVFGEFGYDFAIIKAGISIKFGGK